MRFPSQRVAQIPLAERIDLFFLARSRQSSDYDHMSAAKWRSIGAKQQARSERRNSTSR
jgi:hypothetical protein